MCPLVWPKWFVWEYYLWYALLGLFYFWKRSNITEFPENLTDGPTCTWTDRLIKMYICGLPWVSIVNKRIIQTDRRMDEQTWFSLMKICSSFQAVFQLCNESQIMSVCKTYRLPLGRVLLCFLVAKRVKLF